MLQKKVACRSAFPLLAFLFSLILVQCNSAKKTAHTPNPPVHKTDSREARLRNDVTKYALQYKGAHYVYAGKNPKTGFDCSGFTSYVFSNFDLSLSPSSSMQSKQGVKKSLSAAQPGDLVFFRRSAAGDVFHVALVLEAAPGVLRVIHATTSHGVIVEDLMQSSYWRPYISEIRDVISQ